jgi:DNA-binding transcriptional LysR family regulator
MADRRLQVFSTVARLLSFTKAADMLHMTQPAVTFQIHQLEEHFNTRLFNRTHNRISLTDAGEIVKTYADQIMTLQTEMDNAVRNLTDDPRGQLVLGASMTIGQYVLPTLLGQYQLEFPEVALRLFVANTVGVINMVENNEIDIGIVEGPVVNKNLVTQVCWEDELVVVTPVGHSLAGASPLRIAQVLDYPFIAREEGSGTRIVISNYFEAQGVDVSALNLTMEFGSPESIKGAVWAGLGITIMSIATIEKERLLDRLVATSLDPPIKRSFTIVYQRQKFRLRAIEAFVSFAALYFNERGVLQPN